MSVIRTHEVTLYGRNDVFDVILRPLTDEHLPLLYRWNADPEVLYWSEGDEIESYSPDMVRGIYESVSKQAFCFLVEVNGTAIGDCWLQKMNLPYIQAMYPPKTDIRRIDMMIGEKEYWGKGIGTVFVHMLTEFAFGEQNADVLHCLCEDYNVRSRRVWEKNGFRLVWKEPIPNAPKGNVQLHWQLTRNAYSMTGGSSIPQPAVV